MMISPTLALGCPRVPSASGFTSSLNGLGVGGRRVFAGAVALVLCVVACVKDNARESGASSAAPQAAEPALSLTGDAPWPGDYSADPLWVRASAGDDIDQARLARKESAAALLAGVAHGGSLGRAALAALPYASDRRGARGELCALLARADGASQRSLLDALYDVVINAPDTEDVLDPSSDRRCSKVVEDATRRGLQAPADRDRAEVVLAWLARSP
jgi:hypothetical protein